MNQDNTAKLTALLLQDAPEAHDPLFRLSVLERRERQRYRLRLLKLLATAIACTAIASLFASSGTSLAEAAAISFAGMILLAGFLSASGFIHVMRSMHRWHASA